MSRSGKTMAQLAQVTKAMLDIRQSEMARLAAHEQKLRDLVAGLRKSEVDTSYDLVSASAHLRWQKWVGHRKETLNIELAQVLAAKYARHDSLAKAFSKHEAVKALQKQEAARIKARRIAADS